MIPFKNFGLTEQMFTFVFNDGRSYHWAVDRLRKWLPATGVKYLAMVPVEKAQADSLVEKQTVDEPKVREIIADNKTRDPIIVAQVKYQGEYKSLIIDGNHTYVGAYRIGQTEVPAYILPEDVWTDFLVDLPPDWEAFTRDIVHPTASPPA